MNTHFVILSEAKNLVFFMPLPDLCFARATPSDFLQTIKFRIDCYIFHLKISNFQSSLSNCEPRSSVHDNIHRRIRGDREPCTRLLVDNDPVRSRCIDP